MVIQVDSTRPLRTLSDFGVYVCRTIKIIKYNNCRHCEKKKNVSTGSVDGYKIDVCG